MADAYVYHTAYDSTDNIQLGSVLRCGENVLEVSKALAALNPADLSYDQSEKTPVYFELLGSMTVSYPIWVGSIINMATSVICVLVIVQKLSKLSKKTDITMSSLFVRMLFIFCGRLASLLIGLMWSVGTAKILALANCTMAWFDSLYLLFFLYVMPMIVADIAVTKATVKLLTFCQRIDLQISGLIFMSVHLLFVLLTMMGTFVGFNHVSFPASSFLPMLFLLFPLFATVFLKNVNTITSALFTAFPIACCSYIVVVLIPFFVGIQGRSSVSVNPDLTIGIISGVFTFLILNYSSAKIPQDKFIFYLATTLSLFYAIALVAVLITPLGFPYTEKHQVKRYRVLHTDKTVFRNNLQVSNFEGISIAEEDFHWVDLAGIVPNYEKRVTPTDGDCHAELNCGHPFRKEIFWSDFMLQRINAEN